MATRSPSVHGSAPNSPQRMPSVRGSTPCSTRLSAMCRTNEGVPHSPAGRKSWSSRRWRAVLPEETGTTVRPARSAPSWKPRPAGEETVAEGHVQHVAPAGAGRDQDPGHDLPPHVEIAGRVADHRRLALGSRRGVHAGQLVRRDREEAEGIVLAQVGLARERQGGKLLEPAQPGAAEALAIERHALDRPRHRLAQPLQLQGRAGGGRLRLGLGIPDRAAHERRGGSGNCRSTSR